MNARIAILAVLCISSNALAVETRLSINADADIDSLRSTGQVSVTTGRQGDLYTVDASAVIEVNPQRFEAAATDFELQNRLGMPSTPESHTAATEGDSVIAWIHMSALGTDSRHFLRVSPVRAGLPSPDSWGIQWERIPGQPAWHYQDSPAFGRIEGSMLLSPLSAPDASGRQLFYARYFTLAEVRSFLPAFLISRFVRGQFAANVEEGLRKLEAEAK